MTIELIASQPRPLEARTNDTALFPELPAVEIGSYRLSMADFLILVQYVLTNTDLDPTGDLRVDFMSWLAGLVVVEGRNPGRHRLALPA